eukprot:UN28251
MSEKSLSSSISSFTVGIFCEEPRSGENLTCFGESGVIFIDKGRSKGRPPSRLGF